MSATVRGTDASAPSPWPTIILLALTAFCAAATQRTLDPMLPRIAEVYATTLSAASWTITAYAIVYGGLQLVLGPSGDRYGKLRVIALFAIVAAVASLLCALSGSLASLIAARMLAGVGCAAAIPLAMAWIGDNVAYEKRQAALARFLIGQICGLACGQVFGGLAAEQSWWQWPFLVYALLFAAASGLLWYRAGRHEQAAPRRNEPLIAGLGQVLRRSWPRNVLITVFCEGAAVFCGFSFIASHLHVVGGLSLTHAGMILTVFAAGGLSFALLAKRFIAGLGERGLSRTGGVLMAMALLAISLRPTAAVAIPASYLLGMGFYMLHNTLQTRATQMTPEHRGAAVSLFATAFFLGQAVGTATGGAIIGLWGTTPALLLAALMILPVGATFARRIAAHERLAARQRR